MVEDAVVVSEDFGDVVVSHVSGDVVVDVWAGIESASREGALVTRI